METMRKRLWILVLVLAGILCLGGRVQAAPPADVEEWCGHYYKAFIYSEEKDPLEVHQTFRTMGGYLASLTNPSENEFVSSLVRSYSGYNIAVIGGIHYYDSYVAHNVSTMSAKGKWEWLSGEEWKYAPWQFG